MNDLKGQMAKFTLEIDGPEWLTSKARIDPHAKAFRGELVPTEADLARKENRPYEPASELLARIQAEREKESHHTKTKKKTSRKKQRARKY